MRGKIENPRLKSNIIWLDSCHRQSFKLADGQFLPLRDVKILVELKIYDNKEETTGGAKVYPEALVKSLLDDPEYTDVSLVCEENIILCHRVIMAKMSPVFDAMFKTEMKEKDERVINIEDINHAVLKKVVKYIYTMELEESMEDMEELVYAADKYDISGMMKSCEKVMEKKMDKESVLAVITIAEKHILQNLLDKALKAVKRNRSIWMTDEEFSKYLYMMPKNILVELTKQ